MQRPAHRTDTGLERQPHNELFQRLILTAQALDLRSDFHLRRAFDILASQPCQSQRTSRHPLQQQGAHVGFVFGTADQFEPIRNLLLWSGRLCRIEAISERPENNIRCQNSGGENQGVKRIPKPRNSSDSS